MTVLAAWPQRMVNPVRTYDWGSTTALARLQGRHPSGEPEAELWMGAHSTAPSSLAQVDGTVVPLDKAISQHPGTMLGGHVHDRFGPRLPYLLKVLAIARPLSLQVHPSADRAKAGYDGEVDVLGDHDYVDPFPKPEMLYALEPVDALCGFRPADEAGRLLNLLGTDRAGLLAGLLIGHGSEQHLLENVMRHLVTWPDDDRQGFVEEVGRESRRLLAQAGPHAESVLSPDDRRALTWASRLVQQHPHDPMVAAPLLLDLIRLEPGEVMFIPSGAPHAYLYGLGVEIMGNSDNVLRAGLTHKHVAVDEMLHIVDGDSRPVRDVPFTWLSPYEVAWVPDAAEFQLSRIWVTDVAPVALYPGIAGPQILLCTSGPVTVTCPGTALTLQPGQSAFVGASGGGTISISGPGEVFRASAGGQRLPGL
ncbi:MAG: mannose-6-phosphate isomerase, class I [Kineosporiaceae bacterium]|nr:mannose-6-phosphate isomerase, class I [Kineosporiaceae bacterium]